MKTPLENQKMDARKGGDVFLFELSASIIQPNQNTTRKTTLRGKNVRRKGGDVFPQNSKFAHVASTVNKLSIKVPQKET